MKFQKDRAGARHERVVEKNRQFLANRPNSTYPGNGGTIGSRMRAFDWLPELYSVTEKMRLLEPTTQI